MGTLPARMPEGARPEGSTTPAAMPNYYSGDDTDGRLIEGWLGRKVSSTRRKYTADLEDFARFISPMMAASSAGRTLATVKSLLSSRPRGTWRRQ